jgi:hypothetical protein
MLGIDECSKMRKFETFLENPQNNPNFEKSLPCRLDILLKIGTPKEKIKVAIRFF